eukprot:TRINITY_DN36357_c0_g1_i1.p1 TRINITY_DN36357_c0_g1~~TRINITY_DN36357_c0_g1_i1.p1  ORF type:complete len:609 (+),score=125.85 TRINITY_DN36357_c0_g1_i1:166-1992(+)
MGVSPAAQVLSGPEFRRDVSHVQTRTRRRLGRSWLSGSIVGCGLLAAALLAWAAVDERRGRRLETKIPPDDPLISQPYKRRPEADDRIFIVFHIVGIVYMLLGLNTVCDVYFTGALEAMINKWQIKPDVAGATFMAAGGSAPELFTSLIGACITENDVGFGTIVGSAVFNVLFVIGLCGFAATEEIQLTWWPLFRDCSYYIMGLSLLAFFASDQHIALLEAVILFIVYILYCTVMYFNERLEALTDTAYLNAKKNVAPELAAVEAGATGGKPMGESKALDDDDSSDAGSIEMITVPDAIVPVPSPTKGHRSGGTGEATDCHNIASLEESTPHGTESHNYTSKVMSNCHLHGKMRASFCVGHAAILRHEERMATLGVNPASTGGGTGGVPSIADEILDAPDGEEDEGDLMTKPEGGLDLALWYASLPIYVPLHYSLPTPELEYNKFLLTFVLSLLWIAGFSFLLVWWVDILGQVLHIPGIVMALTVLAAGTSIPDAVSSMAVARMGEGDMAVSSSVGSNIFDILVGLPIPWMLKIGVIEGGDYRIRILSPFVAFYVLLLLIMVTSVIICIHFSGWTLNKRLGLLMGGLYAVFLVVAITTESTQWDALKF